jgi:hypothetical protein
VARTAPLQHWGDTGRPRGTGRGTGSAAHGTSTGDGGHLTALRTTLRDGNFNGHGSAHCSLHKLPLYNHELRIIDNSEEPIAIHLPNSLPRSSLPTRDLDHTVRPPPPELSGPDLIFSCMGSPHASSRVPGSGLLWPSLLSFPPTPPDLWGCVLHISLAVPSVETSHKAHTIAPLFNTSILQLW